jgi:hypothetical protein
MGKSGGETNTVSKFEPPAWAAQHFPEYINRAMGLANEWATNPNLVYGNNGERLVAPLVQEQIDAIGGMRGMAMPWLNNSGQLQQEQGAEHGALMQALGGGMTQGPSEANAFMGVNNPYLDQVISKNAGDMGQAYATGTAAQRATGAARSRAFGGTAEGELAQMQNDQFMNNVGDMANNARMQAYQQSAGLDEARINRNWQGQEAGLGRQFGALQGMPGRMGAQTALMQALLGGGEMSRGLDQQGIEAYKNLHYQNQQLPLIGLDIFGQALTRSSGGAGTTTSQMFGGYNPWQTGMGIAGMGAGLFNAMR